MADFSTQPGPSSGHLGIAWEAALAVILVVIALAVVGVITCQIRKRRTIRRQEEAAELGQAGLEGSRAIATVPESQSKRTPSPRHESRHPSRERERGSASAREKEKGSSSSPSNGHSHSRQPQLSIPKPEPSKASDHHRKARNHDPYPAPKRLEP